MDGIGKVLAYGMQESLLSGRPTTCPFYPRKESHPLGSYVMNINMHKRYEGPMNSEPSTQNFMLMLNSLVHVHLTSFLPLLQKTGTTMAAGKSRVRMLNWLPQAEHEL